MKALMISFVIVIALGCTGTVFADTFTVTRVDDPDPDVCLPADCSLREAAKAAYNHGGADRVQLAAGTYTLVRGELAFGGDLELVGAGSALTHVISDSRLFAQPQDQSLLVRGMKIETTFTTILSMTAHQKAASLALEDVAIPTDGGAVSVYSEDGFAVTLDIRYSDLRTVICNGQVGTCTIVGSQLSSLDSPASANYPGPAIHLTGSVVDGALDPTDAFSGINLHRAALVDIEDSTITRTRNGMNEVADPLVIRLHRLSYSGNALPMSFGVGTDVEITDSEFEANTHRAIRAKEQSTWSIRGTSFIANSVDDNSGGAILVEDAANVHIENSTFSKNTFSVAAAQAGARGAAIGYRNGSGLHVDLQHVTMVPPAVAPAGIQGLTIGGYGGTGDVVVDVNNSIIAGSCQFDAGALHHGVGNIQSPSTTCGFNSASNQVGVSANALAIGSFGDHGGPTRTYEPSIDSVAIDSANTNHCLPLDQRGFFRPSGDSCDVGAVEVGANDILFANGFE
ncbi:MAG: right-handed parallel beta-helix repeat-containing protein [Rudaea sp.]